MREARNTVSAPVAERWSHEDVQNIVAAGMAHVLKVFSHGATVTLPRQLEALRSLSAAFFVVLSWPLLDRGVDVLEMVMNQLQLTDTGIDIYRSRTKTVREAADVGPLHSIASTDGHFDVCRPFRLMIRLHRRLGDAGADLSTGRFFRNIRVQQFKGVPPRVEAGPCSTAVMRGWVQKLCKTAGVSPNGLNALRRGRATKLVADGRSWAEVQAAGGWRDLRMAHHHAEKGLPPSSA
jgi:hypothetical protein